MNDSPTSTTSAATCSCCGAFIASQPPETGDPLCERCFLEPLAAQCSSCGDLNAGFAEALAEALDLREHETGLHSRRVACHTVVLAKHSFPHDERRLAQIYWGALLHDIGKIGVPDRILLKNGPLDDDEWAVMRRHPDDGHHLLSHLAGVEDAAEIVRCHEEHFDGTGYPRGLRGEAIPLGARLFAVIDALDAMTSDRPYRKGLSFDVAKAEIVRLRGSQFDPVAVRLFLDEEPALRRMVELKCSEADFGRADRPSPGRA
ncbi:HD-GYP domain-containing protein [Aromatoleum buckelii]|uniref:HD domain-containing protein n=1 Tax=Aromatoleum buckelii TaxID=200254 RepID=A0ABX1N548_9RHOO|nr:HD-GYP domain-containing protein [Aromatoleum buckelii]MCK0511612.1 HD-GYP domain-containing protein [Aromatoleum buckelii]